VGLSVLYLIIPFLSVVLLPNQWKTIDASADLVMICLGFVSMSIYFVILYGLLPTLGILLTQIKKAMNIDFSEGYSARIGCKRIVYVVRECGRFSSIYFCLAVIAQAFSSRLWNVTLVTNAISIQAHFFLMIIFQLCWNLLSMCFNPSCDSDRVLILQRISVAFLFVILPFITVGKILFAFSLLTVKGQSKAMTFLRFQDDSFCVQSRTKRMSLGCALGDKYVHDLMKFNLFVSVPILIVLLYLRYYSHIMSITLIKMKKSF
jgi:hypothetical protein